MLSGCFVSACFIYFINILSLPCYKHLQNQIQIQHALDSSQQQRAEKIVSVNDNNNENNANNNVNINTHQTVIEISCISSSLNLSEQNSENCEDIEGADELSDPPKPQSVDLEEKRKSIDSAEIKSESRRT